MTWRIQRTDTPSPMYLSMQAGFDVGQPAGAFTPDQRMATLFMTPNEASRAMARLGADAQMCMAEEVGTKALPPELGGFPSGYTADITNRL